MIKVNDKITRILPEKLKGIIRPYYLCICGTCSDQVLYIEASDSTPVDRSPSLAIGSFSGFEVACRKNAADEPVIGHSFDKDIFFTGVPECQPAKGQVIIDLGAHLKSIGFNFSI